MALFLNKEGVLLKNHFMVSKLSLLKREKKNLILGIKLRSDSFSDSCSIVKKYEKKKYKI